MHSPSLPGLDTGDGAARGTAIHACFEEVDWIDQGTPDHDALTVAIRRQFPRHPAEWVQERLEEFEGYLSLPSIQKLLRKPEIPTVLYREEPFVRRVPGGLQRAVIDRLVLFLGEDGLPQRAEVIDFKTDKESSPEEFLLRHEGQYRQYVEIVAATYGLEPNSVRAILVELATGITHHLPEVESG